MTDRGFILDKPEDIQMFGLLQVYHGLKLEVQTGMGWAGNRMTRAARQLVAATGVTPKRLKKDLLVQMETVVADAKRKNEAALVRHLGPGPCPCECNRGGFCGGCGHAGCGGRNR